MLFKKAPATLMVPLLFWIAGIYCGYNISLGWIAGAVILLIILIINKSFTTRYALLLLIIFMAGTLRIQTEELHPKSHISKILENFDQGVISGKITKVIKPGRSYRLKVLEFNDQKASGNIRLTCYNNNLIPGDVITADVKLEKLEGARFPTQKDWRQTWKARKIYGFGIVDKFLKPVLHNPNLVQKSQNWLTDRLKNRLGNHYYAGGALLLGDTSEITYNYKELLQKAGLSHLFALSGMHIGLIALFVLITLKLFFKKRTSYNILLILLIFYGFLCNWTPSISRAIIMFTIYRISRFMERPVNFLQVIAVSLFIITIINPLQVFSIGLQLSVLAVTVIYFISDHLQHLVFKNKLLNMGFRFVALPLLLAFSITVIVSPITISNFQVVSFNAIFGIIPAGIILSILLPAIILIVLMPVFWQPIANAYLVLLHFFNATLKVSANMPLRIENINLGQWQVLVIYAIFGFSLILSIKYRKKLYLLLNLAIIFTTLPFWNSQSPNEGIMRISCIDCGQGDMTFVELPDGENLLIDTGPPDGNGRIAESLIPWLQKRRIRDINYAVVTHAHNDHYGGIIDLFDALNVKCVITDASFFEDIEDLEVLKAIDQENCREIILHDTLSFNLGPVLLKFLYPLSKLPFTNINNNSLVLQIKYGNFSALFTGDIEEEAEEILIKTYGKKLKSDFLKIPHHGSNSSSTIPFIECIDPEIGFIPAGKNNRFGFPHNNIVKRYSYLKDDLVIAAKDGSLILETDGDFITKEVFLRK